MNFITYFEKGDTLFLTQRLVRSSKAGGEDASDVGDGEGYAEELETKA